MAPSRLSIDEIVAADGSGPVKFPDGIDVGWSTIANHPTTLAGYAISDAYTKTEIDAALALRVPFAAFSWDVDGAVYLVAPVAMTLDTPIVAGTGTLAYAKALAASPTVFNTVTLPVSLAVGDVLRVTVTSVSGYKALTLTRTA